MSRSEEHEFLLRSIAAELCDIAPVYVGTMFSSPGLRWDGKIVAFLRRDAQLVVKLPRDRGQALIQAGNAEVVTMGKRTMKEWFAIGAGSDVESTHDQWLGLAREALAFVRATELER